MIPHGYHQSTPSVSKIEQARTEITRVVANIGASVDPRMRGELAQSIIQDVQKVLGVPTAKPWRNVIRAAISADQSNVVDIMNCAAQSLKELLDEQMNVTQRNTRLRNFYETFFNSLVSSLKAEEDDIQKCNTVLGIPNFFNERLDCQPLRNTSVEASLQEGPSRRYQIGPTDRNGEITSTFDHSDRTSETPSSSATSSEHDSAEGTHKDMVTSSIERPTPHNPKKASIPTKSCVMTEKERTRAPEPIIEISEEQATSRPHPHQEVNLELFGEDETHSSKPAVQETIFSEPSSKEAAAGSTRVAIMQHSYPNDEAIKIAKDSKKVQRGTSPEPRESEELHETAATNEVDSEITEIVEEMETINSRDTSTPIPDGENPKNASPTPKPVEQLPDNFDDGGTSPNIDEDREDSSADNPLSEQPPVPHEQPRPAETVPRRSSRKRTKPTRDGSVEYAAEDLTTTPVKSNGKSRSRARKKITKEPAGTVETTSQSSFPSSEGVDLRSSSGEIDAGLPFISNPDLYKRVSGTDEASPSTTLKKPPKKRPRPRPASHKRASESVFPAPTVSNPVEPPSSGPSTSLGQSSIHSSWNNAAIDYTTTPNYNANYYHSHANYYHSQNGSFPNGCEFGFQPNTGYQPPLDGYPGVSLNYPQHLHSFNSNPESTPRDPPL